jgi:hypothetical protein
MSRTATFLRGGSPGGDLTVKEGKLWIIKGFDVLFRAGSCLVRDGDCSGPIPELHAIMSGGARKEERREND